MTRQPTFTNQRTIEQIMLHSSRNNYHFFSESNMRFSGSRVHSEVYGGCVFVTSEYTGFDRSGRAYSVRVMHENGSISTFKEFLRHSTRYSAHAEAKWLGEQILKGNISYSKNGYGLEVIEKA